MHEDGQRDCTLSHHVIQISNVDVYLFYYQNNKSSHFLDTSFFSLDAERPRVFKTFMVNVWPHCYRNITFIILTLKSIKSRLYCIYFSSKSLKIFGTHICKMILYVLNIFSPNALLIGIIWLFKLICVHLPCHNY